MLVRGFKSLKIANACIIPCFINEHKYKTHERLSNNLLYSYINNMVHEKKISKGQG